MRTDPKELSGKGMGAIVMFGVRGSRNSEKWCRTIKEANTLADRFAHVLIGGRLDNFEVDRNKPIQVIKTDEHYVSVQTRAHWIEKGPAASSERLWPREIKRAG